MLKNYLKSYLYLFTSIIILTLILSIINYFYNFPINIIKILIPIISLIIATIILGKNTKIKAYLEGLKFTSIYIIISFIIFSITQSTFTIKIFLYYIIQLLSGIIGSMIGINLNKKS